MEVSQFKQNYIKMDSDIITYAYILTFSISFGYFYREIKNKGQKKWVGTCVGLLIVLITARQHIWHPIFLFTINACIILWLPKSNCHLVSFFFSFLHLLFFRTNATNFGISYLPVHTNMIQMMLTLKLVGLAFEVNSTHLRKQGADNKTKEQRLEDASNDVDPNFLDMFHYTFNYIGIATGPYFRYRTFSDFFNLPFSGTVSWNKETLKGLSYVPPFFVLYLWGTYNWPLSYALSEEFYDRSWVYRFWYAWPTFFIFRMQVYSGVLMSEGVCTMVGFGAYPSVAEPKPGHGPSKNFLKMKEITESRYRLENEEYSFRTIHSMCPYQADFCTTVRDGMKNWNMCIQYWLLTNIYKRFPNKKLRTSATMLVSAFWHGSYIGYYVCISSVPFYLALEDVYVKLFLKDNSGMSLKVWEWILWFCKMQAFSYLSVAFHLLALEEVIRYYKSTYFCGFIIGAILYVAGTYMLAKRKAEIKADEAKMQTRENNNSLLL